MIKFIRPTALLKQNIAAGNRWLAANRANLLIALFSSALTFRLCYVFINNPFSYLTSDMGRHWQNAGTFLHPNLWGSNDPLMYQAYLSSVRFITHDTPWCVSLCTGLLSASMPWFWYKALKELLPKDWAMAGGIVIALIPSLLVIYSYFLQETLLITLIAAATWLSLRALRLNTLGSFIWATVIWTLACFTRMQAVPMAGVFIGLLCIRSLRQTAGRTAIAAAFFSIMLVPACWHSMVNFNFCSPFGVPYITQIYRLSQNRNITITTVNDQGGAGWIFGAPNFFNQPFEPFSDWYTARRGEVHIDIDLRHGRKDWEAELERVRNQPKPLGYLLDWEENVIFLFFGPTWPDSDTSYPLGWMSAQSRWLTLPMTLLVLFFTLRYRRSMPWPMLLIPGVALMMMGLLAMQQTFMNEGRYRKPVDPLLIASCVILLHERQRRRNAPS